MSRQSRIAACLLSFALCPVAIAQTTATESTTVKTQVRGGEVEAVYGNKVVMKEADGLHEYTLPDGFKFQLDGKDVGVDELKPGMKVGAVITDKITTRQVTTTRVASATVMQIAPGGIVVKNEKGELKSYNFKDKQGNDIYFIRDGKEVSLRSVKKGERLSGTFVTTLPPQQIAQRSVKAKAVAPPPEPAAPAEVAAATPPRRLPKTASPLPLVGLLAALSAGIALTLRAARAAR